MSTATADEHPAVATASRKIYRRIIVLFALMMMLNQIDRSNIGFVQEDLEAHFGIGAAAYGLGAGLFFVGYFLFEVPSNALMQRVGAKIWITRICITWGAVSAAMIFVRGETSFYVLRFLLGVAEAGFVPAVLFYISSWLPNRYQGRATGTWAVGALFAYSAGSLVSGPLLSLHGFLGLDGWQWLFLLEGSITILVGIVGYFLLDSKISDAKWLTEEERTQLSLQIASERASDTEHASTTATITKLLRSPVIHLFMWIYFAVQMCIYSTTFWLPSVVRDIGVSSDNLVGLLSALPWLCTIPYLYFVSRRGDRHPQQRTTLMTTSLVLAAIGTLVASLTGSWLGLVFIVVATLGFKTVAPVFWPLLRERTDPVTAATAIALINSVANLGGFVAPYGFGLVEDSTGSTELAMLGLGVVIAIAAAATLLVRRIPLRPTADPSAAGPGALGRTDLGPVQARTGANLEEPAPKLR
ncbi:MFS transporter [Streptomyces sp. CoH17]|uniref:MFS transporter n=1 Tax=Streptomyces sp. CoH17 TaxID=2992806 RepID=UPI00226F0CF4|nr:MFS transporter [Streptomyces sp. CoH17]